MVPEADDAEAAAAEIGGPGSVGVGAVLAAVGLDDQPSLEAGEVGDERADAVLEAELAAEPAPAQPRPEQALSSVEWRRNCAAWGLTWRFTGGIRRTLIIGGGVYKKRLRRGMTPLPSLRERGSPGRRPGR